MKEHRPTSVSYERKARNAGRPKSRKIQVFLTPLLSQLLSSAEWNGLQSQMKRMRQNPVSPFTLILPELLASVPPGTYFLEKEENPGFLVTLLSAVAVKNIRMVGAGKAGEIRIHGFN